MKRKKKDSDKNTTLEKDISAKLLIVSFVRVKIHQYTSFNGTSIKLSTILALLKLFEILVRPQFLDSGCTFYKPELSPQKELHTTRFHFLCKTNFNEIPLCYCFENFSYYRKYQKQPSAGVPLKRFSGNIHELYRRTTILKCDFNKAAKQRNYNHTLAWVFSCNFAAYQQNTFSQKHLWVAASEKEHQICENLSVAASEIYNENDQGLFLLKIF